MMIVVPAFAKRQQRDPPAVGGAIAHLKVSIAKLVAGTIDKASTMKPDKQAHKNAPDDKGHTPQSVE